MTLKSWAKIWEAYGFKCLARINEPSPLATVPVGYVGLSKIHPDYGKNYDDIDVDAPGGLTFAGTWEDQNDGLWYVGFDCGHAWDTDPFSGSLVSNKSLEYVIEETEELAQQLAERQQ